MMRSPFRRLTLTILLLPLLTGCAGNTTGSVAKQWALAFRELQIAPVFPMREDVQVGDIYYVPVAPEDQQKVFDRKGFLPISTFVGTVKWNVTPSENRLSTYYQTRLSFPATVTKPPGDDGKNPPDIYPEPTSQDDVFRSGDLHRLRLVGFPSFMSVTFSRGDLAALIPAEALSITAGVSSLKNVTVSIPVAESYGVPWSRLADQIMGSDGHLNLDIVPGSLLAQLPGAAPAAAAAELPGRLVVIYEVYYARAVDIGIQAERTAGFGAGVNPPGSGGNAGTAPAPPGSGGASGPPPAASGSSGSANAGPLQFPTIQAMDTLWKGLGAAAPGGSLRLMGYNGTYVSLRRVFERPLAIGYRGVSFRMVRQGNEIKLGVDPGGGSGYVPTFSQIEPLVRPKGGTTPAPVTPARLTPVPLSR